MSEIPDHLDRARIYLSDPSDRAVDLWSVRDISPGWFSTRAMAESAALAVFPSESASDRYYRLHVVRFFQDQGWL